MIHIYFIILIILAATALVSASSDEHGCVSINWEIFWRIFAGGVLWPIFFPIYLIKGTKLLIKHIIKNW